MRSAGRRAAAPRLRDGPRARAGPGTLAGSSRVALGPATKNPSADDVLLTGVPDLWQFNFMCGGNGVSANAVGCGPVSAGMLMYWWAQQGYEALVDDFLVGDGSGPADREHDWQALVRELRANYLNGGICVPSLNGNPQYATPMDKMETGLREYIEHAGYDVRVEHWKVCEDCNAGAADEIQGAAALGLIKDELEAGPSGHHGIQRGQGTRRVGRDPPRRNLGPGLHGRAVERRTHHRHHQPLCRHHGVSPSELLTGPRADPDERNL